LIFEFLKQDLSFFPQKTCKNFKQSKRRPVTLKTTYNLKSSSIWTSRTKRQDTMRKYQLLFRFEVEALFRFSWSALCKRQKLSKAKSRKKVFFSQKNFEKRFHDNKKSLLDEKHVFYEQNELETINFISKSNFCWKKEDFNVTLMMI
jgi:hypothetical protein